MPDVFNPILALAVICIAAFWNRLSNTRILLLMAAIAAAVTIHMTHLLSALGLLVVAMLLRWRPRCGAAILCAVLAGCAALLMVGRVGFHQWSLAPQAPPFLLARIIEDGPGRLYLREHCPQLHSVMCRYTDRLDVPTVDFLWHYDGVYSAPDVSPEVRAAIRSEEKRLYLAAALDHPALWLKTSILNTARQLGNFRLRDYIIPSWATYTPQGMQLWPEDDPSLPNSASGHREPQWQLIWDVPIYATTLVSIAYLLILAARRELTREQTDTFILAMAASWLAALAGAVSEISPRYETRTIWLIPFVAALVFVARRSRLRGGREFAEGERSWRTGPA